MRNKIVFLVAATSAFSCAFAAVTVRPDPFAQYAGICIAFAWLALLDDERIITLRNLIARVERLERKEGS